MTIWVRQQSGNKNKGRPFLLDKARPECESDDARKCPDWLENTNQSTLIQFFAHPGDAQEGDDVENVGWYSKEVSVELRRG